MNNGKNLIISATVVVILAAAVGFFVWWKYYKKAPVPAQTTPTAATEAPQTLGGQIYEQVQNPAEKLPETNPFGAKVNPFEEAKTNPYKDVYKNPFE